MMRVKFVVWLVVAVLVGGVLYATLPKFDVVELVVNRTDKADRLASRPEQFAVGFSAAADKATLGMALSRKVAWYRIYHDPPGSVASAFVLPAVASVD
jgi:hypothetical protein